MCNSGCVFKELVFHAVKVFLEFVFFVVLYSDYDVS